MSRSTILAQLCITFCLAFLPACFESVGEHQTAHTMRLRHPNGLIIGLPPPLIAEQTTSGFRVKDPVSMSTRYLKEVEVQLVSQTFGILPNLSETRTVAGRKVYYEVHVLSGGSGGPEHSLIVMWLDGDTAVLYQQNEQSGDAEPRFELCWELVGHTDLTEGE